MPSYELAQAPSSPPLNPAELRETATNLIELKADRERINILNGLIDQMKQLETRESQVHDKEVAVQAQLTTVAERERDIEKQRGDTLDMLLKQRDSKGGFGCALKKIFTLGLGRCG